MHERNPYSGPQDFKLLASRYPLLQPFVNRNGGIDFQNATAQRTLTKAILKADFDLEVELPDDRLCPPVPNRLNYVLWIEDIIQETRKFRDLSRRVSGLDVGTGASAIYPLLCCRQNPTWEMYATEIDAPSLSCAQRNVSTNGLEGQIHLSHAAANGTSAPSRVFGPLFADPDLHIDFTMCNPPFYSGAAEIQASKFEKEDEALSTCTGSTNEMIYPPSSPKDASIFSPYAEFEREGGEVAFVSRMVEESLIIRGRCAWYTSMLGKMSSVPKIVSLFQAVGIVNYAVTQFVQGKTRRWAIGWSVGRWDRLPDAISRLSYLPSSHPLAKAQPGHTTLEYSLGKDPATVIAKTLEGMKLWGVLEVEKVDPTSGVEVEFIVKAKENTWSRAARRKVQQQQKHAQQNQATAGKLTVSPQGTSRKRKHDEGQDDPGNPRKKGRPDASSSPFPELEDHKLICAISIVDSTENTVRKWTLQVRWVYGREEHREMFEGFASHVERKVAEGVRR